MSLLSSVPLFQDLSNSELQSLELFCQERFIKAWTVLFYENDEATAMYIVKTWKMKAYRERNWVEQTLWHISSWEFVWEMAFFDWNDVPKTRMATVRATEDSNVVVIMNYSIIDLAKKHKEIFDKIVKTIDLRKSINRWI